MFMLYFISMLLWSFSSWFENANKILYIRFDRKSKTFKLSRLGRGFQYTQTLYIRNNPKTHGENNM